MQAGKDKELTMAMLRNPHPGEILKAEFLDEIGLSQNRLAQLTGIPQSTISAIENGRVRVGVERAKVLARALNCHPGVLVFPGWELRRHAAA